MQLISLPSILPPHPYPTGLYGKLTPNSLERYIPLPNNDL